MKNDNCEDLTCGSRAAWMISGVLIGVGAIVVMVGHTATGIFAAAELPRKDSADRVIATFLHGGQGDGTDASKTFNETDDLLQKCAVESAPLQVPLEQIRNDPFRFNSNIEPALDSGNEQKSDGDRIAMLQELGKLQLQSICSSSDHSACMIDNRLYHEGEQINSFTIERIGEAAVVIRNGGYRFELKVAG